MVTKVSNVTNISDYRVGPNDGVVPDVPRADAARPHDRPDPEKSTKRFNPQNPTLGCAPTGSRGQRAAGSGGPTIGMIGTSGNFWDFA